MGPAIFIPMAIGAVVNTGVAIAKGKPFGEVLTSGLTGAAVGAATGGIGSLLSAGTSTVAPVVSEGVSQAAQGAAQSGITEGASQVAQGAAQNAITAAPTAGAIAPAATPIVGTPIPETASQIIAPTAEAVAKPSLMTDLSNLANTTGAGAVTPTEAFKPSLMGAPQPDVYSRAALTAAPQPDVYSKANLLDTLQTQNAPTSTIAKTTTAQDDYLKALTERLKKQEERDKINMYIQGGKTATDIAGQLTQKEPTPPPPSMGGVQPIQLTGGNIDLMAQLMALAGGR